MKVRYLLDGSMRLLHWFCDVLPQIRGGGGGGAVFNVESYVHYKLCLAALNKADL